MYKGKMTCIRGAHQQGNHVQLHKPDHRQWNHQSRHNGNVFPSCLPCPEPPMVDIGSHKSVSYFRATECNPDSATHLHYAHINSTSHLKAQRQGFTGSIDPPSPEITVLKLLRTEKRALEIPTPHSYHVVLFAHEHARARRS